MVDLVSSQNIEWKDKTWKRIAAWGFGDNVNTITRAWLKVSMLFLVLSSRKSALIADILFSFLNPPDPLHRNFKVKRAGFLVWPRDF